MNTQAIEIRREPGRGRARKILRAAGLSLAVLALAAVRNQAGTERDARPAGQVVDRARILHLQRWVSAGHDQWCKDARMVAGAELRRVAPEFPDSDSLPEFPDLDQLLREPKRQVYVWTTPDGKRTYQVALERYRWLLPVAGKTDDIIWVPTGTAVRAHD